MASSKPTAPHCGAFLLPVLHGQRMGADSTRQAPGCDPACAWSWHWCSPGKALAVVAGDRAGAGAALGFNQAKPKPWVLVLNQGKPRPWGPVIELVQAQHWASTRQSPGPGCRCSTRVSPGCGPACAWSWHRCRCWCSTRQSAGHGHNFNQAQALGAGAGAALGFNQARPRPWAQIQWGEFPRIPMAQPAMTLPKIR